MARQRRNQGEEKVVFELRNDWQVDAWEVIEHHKLTLLRGVAGTSKTFIATSYAIWALHQGLYDKVFISRPVVSAAGEDLGFLPGGYEKKVDPYMTPIYDCIDKVVGGSPALKKSLMERIFVFPIAYARGRTLDNAVCILDEAQNTTLPQMKLWLTRLGQDSKMIITGDQSQSDIGKNSCLNWVCDRLKGIKGVGQYTFPLEAIVRDPLVGDIIEALSDSES